MKRLTRTGYLISILAILLFTSQACGDDPVSTDEPDPPSPPTSPELAVVSIDDSYFQQNEPDDPEDEEFMPYMISQQGVIEVAAGIGNINNVPNLIFNERNNHDYEYDDGEWSWEYPYTIAGNLIDHHQDVDIDARVTVTENNVTGDATWNIHISTDDPEIGPLDQHNLYTFVVSEASVSGNFVMNDPESDIEATIRGNWTHPSDSEKTLELNIIEEENGTTEIDMNYSQSGTQFSLLVDDSGNPDTPILITWETASGTGSIDTQDGLFCWDETLRMTDC